MVTASDIDDLGRKLSDDQLVAIVKEKGPERPVLRALKELCRRNSPRRVEAFGLVLDEPQYGVSAKRTAVAELGRMTHPESQDLLLRHLDAHDLALLPKVVQALGRIGDAKALERLEKVDQPDSATAQRALAFARSFISYRLRLDRHLLSPPSAADMVDVGEGIPFTVVEPKVESVHEALQITQKELPAIPLADIGTGMLACYDAELLLAFNKAFVQPEVLATIRERCALPVVLLKKDLSLERYYVGGYFFTQPSEGGHGVVVLGTRPSGALTYAGTVKIADEGFTFALRSVDTRYAPAIDVVTTYDPAKRAWSFDKAITSTQVAEREKTTRTPRAAVWKPG